MSRISPLVLVAVTVAALVALTSCVKLERQPVDKRFFALEVVRPGEPLTAPAAKGGTVLVRRVQMSPRVSGRELVYHMADSSWTADYYNLFFVPPADMLSQDLRSWLSSTGLYANVVDPGSLLVPTRILETNVVSLHGDFSSKPAQAVVEMQFMLLDNGVGASGTTLSGGRKVLLTTTVRRTAELAENSPQALVRALHVAVTQCYAELETQLQRLPAH
jgi:Protein of unknown function (DUF330).